MPTQPLQLPGYAASQTLDFSPLAQLGQTYKQTQQQQKLSDLGKGLADGTLDYRQAAAQAADMGDIGSVYKFLTLDEARKKQALEMQAGKDFSASMAPYFGGGTSTAPTGTAQPIDPARVAPTAPGNLPPAGAPMASGRAPVASSSKVWGDDEGVAAGLYPPAPGQQPVQVASLGSAPAMPTPSGRSQTTSGMSGQPPAPQAVAEAGPGQTSAPRAATPAPGQIPVPVLIQAMSNPNLPTAQKEIAGKLLTRALDNTKPNEKIQYLQQLKESSGYRGTPLELEMELRRASKTDVNTVIDQKTETEENKAAGKAAGERRATMFASAGSASKTLQNLSRTEALLEQVAQGKLQPAKLTVSAWAKALGMNDETASSLGLDPKGIGSAQALQSLVNESVVGKIGAGGFPANNFSDADRAFITDIFPKLSNDPRGNRIMVEGARRMAQLDMQRARDYQKFKADPGNKGRGFEDFELEFSEKVAKQDVFGDLRKQAEAITGPARSDIGGTMSNPGAPQQRRDAAPPSVQGARRAPDGNYYVPDPQRPGKFLQVQ